MKQNPTLRLYEKLSRYKGGKWLFTFLVCQKAPYFSTLGARISVVQTGRVVVLLPKRRRVQNHIGTVHAIAMANACELAMGVMAEASVPPDMRWLPRGMNIEYRKKAATDLRVVAWLRKPIVSGDNHDIRVPVDVIDTNGEIVAHADIPVYISRRKPE